MVYRNEVLTFIAIHPNVCGNSYHLSFFIFYIMYYLISFFHVLHFTSKLYSDAIHA